MFKSKYSYSKRALPGLWSPVRAAATLPVHHFKWHDGVLQSATDRLHHYKGDRVDGGAAAQPRFQHFVESERILKQLGRSRRVSLTAAHCTRDPALL